MTYIMLEKKSHTVICQGKKFLSPEVWKKILTQTKSSIPLPTQKLNDQPHRVGEEADLTPY